MPKYILFDTEPRTIRIFDAFTDHAQVAGEVGRPIVSAGTVWFGENGKPNCAPGSATLSLFFDLDQSFEDGLEISRLFQL